MGFKKRPTGVWKGKWEKQLKLPPVHQPMPLLEGEGESRSCEHTSGPPKTPVSIHPNPLQGFTTGNKKGGLQVYLCLVGVIRAAVAPQQGRATGGLLPAACRPV